MTTGSRVPEEPTGETTPRAMAASEFTITPSACTLQGAESPGAAPDTSHGRTGLLCPETPPGAPAALPSLPQRPPTPTTTLLAELRELDVEAVDAGLVGVREAWRRGDQAVIADALIEQAALLEALGARLLKLADGGHGLKAVEVYAQLALRSFDQARKTLTTLAGMRGAPRQQTNIQVNVGGPTNEVLAGGSHGT